MIPMDFVCGATSVSMLPGSFCSRMVRFALYFAPGILEDNHTLRQNTVTTIAYWKVALKKVVVGSQFKDYTSHGYNQVLVATSGQMLFYNRE